MLHKVLCVRHLIEGSTLAIHIHFYTISFREFLLPKGYKRTTLHFPQRSLLKG